jgi:hypothetical protein
VKVLTMWDSEDTTMTKEVECCSTIETLRTEMLEWFSTGNNILGRHSCKLAISPKGTALAYAAMLYHRVNKHHIERLVKRGAECAKTQKGQHMQSIYATTDNGFLTEHHSNDGCVTSETAEEEGDQDDNRRRGHFGGPNRIHHFNEQVMKKTEQLTAIEIKLGAAAYEAKHLKIYTV